MNNNEEAKTMTEQFETWAVNHLGQGYSLEKEDHTYSDKVTRWAFVAYKAGRKEAATQRILQGRVLVKELYNTLLWLYRRLPQAYANPPHIDAMVKRVAKVIGENPQEFLDERKPKGNV